jgi:hypothetical protein
MLFGAPRASAGPPAQVAGFRITPFAGVLFAGGIEPQADTGFLEDLSRPSSFLVGFRASRPLSRLLAFEFTLSRSRTENLHRLLYNDPEPLEGNPPFGIQTLRNSINPVLRLGGSLLVAAPLQGPVSPHVTIGLGWVRHLPRRQVSAEIAVPLEDGTVFADTIAVPEENVRLSGQGRVSFDLGGGLTARLSTVLSLRLDAILHVSRFSPLDVAGPLTGDVFYAAPQWVSDWEVSTGLVFSVPRSGWTAGPIAGLTVHRFRGDDVEDSARERSLFAGVSFRYWINSAVSIQPELLRIDRTVRATGSEVLVVAGEADTSGGSVSRKERADLTFRSTLKDLEIPLLLRLTIPVGAAVRPYVLGGPSLSLNLAGDYRMEYASESLSGDFPFHRGAEFGLVAGGGLEVDVGPGTLSGGIRLSRSFTKTDDSPGDFGGPFDVRGQVLMIHAGYTL